MPKKTWVVVLVVCLSAFAAGADMYAEEMMNNRTWCQPSDTCWPAQAKIDELKAKLSGTLLQVQDYTHINDFTSESKQYTKDTEKMIMSQRYITKPGIVVEVANQNDVKECILFANTHNIRLSVITSGHDFIGRNTAKGSLQINLYHLRSIAVNINESVDGSAGTVEVGVGNSWARVYEELDTNYKRVIVGGASPWVSMGGYTLGGGHSPMTRKLGLAVDNVIVIHMVTAKGAVGVVTKDGWNFTEVNGSINANSDPDLFWAMRGGGGGTFGVVTKIKFKIHAPPSKFTRLSCTWTFTDITQNPAPIKSFIKKLGELMPTLPREWGGYVLLGPNVPTVPSLLLGYVLVSMVHWGNKAQAESTIKSLMDFGPLWRVSPCTLTEYPSFWAMWKTNNDTSWSRTYIYSGNILRNTWSSNGLADDIVNGLQESRDKGVFIAGTGTFMGGRTTDFSDDSSSVVSGFRNADMAWSFGSASPTAAEDEKYISATNEAAQKYYKHTKSGYLNEPDFKKSNWKEYYWGTSKYEKLLTLKKKWDPDRVFVCHHCVGGSDSGAHPATACGSLLVVSLLVVFKTLS